MLTGAQQLAVEAITFTEASIIGGSGYLRKALSNWLIYCETIVMCGTWQWD